MYSLIWVGLALLIIAFFVGIETAFISVNRLSIELKKKQGKKSGIVLSKFLENPSRFVGTCIIGSNIFLVIYVLQLGGVMRESLWNPLKLENIYIKLAFDTVVAFIIVVLIADFLPRILFRAKNDALLKFFTPVSDLFYSTLYPISKVFVAAAEGILKYLFNVKVKSKGEPFTKIDLEHFFQQTKEQDADGQELNSELFENALSLPTIKIRQCLVPRTEIEAVEMSTSLEETLKRFIDTRLSKIVVYDGNIDNIQGYLHQLDMLKRPEELKSVLLPIPVVPETMSATDLINKFTKERKSIAWVVDEFGGTAGIVTMEDLLEEIFGEIFDEYDTEEFVEKKLSENEFIFSGRIELDFLNEKYDFEFPENELETLSGYIISEHETIPKLKERIIIDKYEFDILNVSDTRIEMVKMKILR